MKDKLNYFTIFLTDIINLSKDLLNIYQSINNKKVLVINKCDLIPKNINLNHLAQNIQKNFSLKEEVIFISAKKNYNLGIINNLISLNKNVIFCGETSSGKSTLINNLFSSNLTTSKYQNTTLDFIKLKYEDNTIFDSPGILLNEEKGNVEKIVVLTKKLSEEFTLTINDLKLKGEGNITLFLDSKTSFKSKKEDIKLDKEVSIHDACDIELFKGGFIFTKNAKIKSNKELVIRKSIIK